MVEQQMSWSGIIDPFSCSKESISWNQIIFAEPLTTAAW